MLPAFNPCRSRETHRAIGLPAEHAFADVARADGGGNCRSHRGATQVGHRDRHGPRAKILIGVATTLRAGRTPHRGVAIFFRSTALCSALEKLFCPSIVVCRSW